MKDIRIGIPQHQRPCFFGAIRDKIDYLKVLAYSLRLLLTCHETKPCSENSWLRLIIDKMSRLFFYTENKVYSISFPFTILTNEKNEIEEIRTKSGRDIDNRAVSAILAILGSESFSKTLSLRSYDIDSDSIDIYGIDILEELLTVEPSYIRYDIDDVRANGHMHPVHHIDVNYSSYSTFKLGFQKKISEEDFIDIQNIRTNCFYMVNSNKLSQSGKKK